ncbi:hypothetical protein ACJIZ3_014665 [Penstemon smallii]|uniref:SPX domain-containing protein n=1 Tax=Penstemon smallii TaxID=265156 RepID=A0ABD3RMH0_9LAMI
MKFGKEFRIHLEKTLPDWRDKYLCYKLLKKLLKNIPADNPQQEWFVGILNEEVEKFNDFYVDKEEDFIIRFQALKEIIERVKERGSNERVFTSETEFSEEIMEIRKDFVSIHGEMVLLKNYSSLNFAGLIKILKKYDKRTGELLTLPFTQLAFQQPFFTTEPLSRLVHECEANLEVLFPLEAEVVESTGTRHGDVSNAAFGATLSLGEETVDIYQSTLAAITAIKGLKKASSTYNPLSMSYIFGNQDNENTGAVTEENSPCDSLKSLHNEEDANVHTPSPK